MTLSPDLRRATSDVTWAMALRVAQLREQPVMEFLRSPAGQRFQAAVYAALAHALPQPAPWDDSDTPTVDHDPYAAQRPTAPAPRPDARTTPPTRVDWEPDVPDVSARPSSPQWPPRTRTLPSMPPPPPVPEPARHAVPPPVPRRKR